MVNELRAGSFHLCKEMQQLRWRGGMPDRKAKDMGTFLPESRRNHFFQEYNLLVLSRSFGYIFSRFFRSFVFLSCWCTGYYTIHLFCHIHLFFQSEILFLALILKKSEKKRGTTLGRVWIPWETKIQFPVVLSQWESVTQSLFSFLQENATQPK